ncbi:MAG TPA: SH3 domain-containing C40 family peptidase, partial [Longimicrobiales bacterium]|nr:SH3 domain-containing C40 family peptidase [Longimicrobiales bacterium]
EAGVPLTIQVLPDRSLSPRSDALVRSAVAPLYRRATMNAAQVSQYVLGNRVTLLYRHGPFWRVRGEDGHVGWIHRGYLLRAEPERTLAWERAEGGEPVVSLGAELQDPAGNTFARLPWGARVIRLSRERILLPDGREGTLGGGEVVGADRLADRFPPLGESITRTARRWLGAPYLWGGVTPAGVDCSGLIQSVFWIHGVAMPRDSDLQVRIGVEVDPGDDFSQLLPGDLLFFAGKGPVDHVALSLRGPHIIHSSASNGGVDLNDLSGDLPVERMLRRGFVRARRVLADRPRVDRPATDRHSTDSPSA